MKFILPVTFFWFWGKFYLVCRYPAVYNIKAMEAMMYLDKNTTFENAQLKALLEIFEQIGVFNEIGYQTSHLAACAALNKIKMASNSLVIDDAISQLNSLMERCRTASDKIDRLARSGSMITCKAMKNDEAFII